MSDTDDDYYGLDRWLAGVNRMSNYPDTTTFPRVRDRVPPAVIERQRISKAVRGLPTFHHPLSEDGLEGWMVSLDAVLEIIDGQP